MQKQQKNETNEKNEKTEKRKRSNIQIAGRPEFCTSETTEFKQKVPGSKHEANAAGSRLGTYVSCEYWL